MAANPNVVEQLLAQEHARVSPPKRLPPLAAVDRNFSVMGEDRYRLTIPELGISLEVDRLRRERNELIGELCVRCELPGARTVNGILSAADFNLSSLRTRADRARFLEQRSSTRGGVDWTGILEEFCQRVLEVDRIGQPAVDLRTVPAPTPDDNYDVEGIVLPRRHPSILFGDGGSAKSYLALYLAGLFAQSGVKVGIFDWELCASDHRDRLERLFLGDMPRILYARCEKPLIYECDRLRRIVRENQLEYLVYDSVAFACDAAPESAETAGKYFRAVRQIGGGSLHIAHVSKTEGANEKPFGSVFWSNSARSTWYAQLVNGGGESNVLNLGLFHRKSNLGRLRPPIGFTVTFSSEETRFQRSDIGDTPDLARQLSVSQRMAHLLKRGSMTVTQIAEELEIEVNTVTQTVNRYVRKDNLFIILGGENTNRKIGLKAP